MKTKTFEIDRNGVVRYRKTGKIFTVLGEPSLRQKIRFFFKRLVKIIIKSNYEK